MFCLEPFDVQRYPLASVTNVLRLQPSAFSFQMSWTTRAQWKEQSCIKRQYALNATFEAVSVWRISLRQSLLYMHRVLPWIFVYREDLLLRFVTVWTDKNGWWRESLWAWCQTVFLSLTGGYFYSEFPCPACSSDVRNHSLWHRH